MAEKGAPTAEAEEKQGLLAVQESSGSGARKSVVTINVPDLSDVAEKAQQGLATAQEFIGTQYVRAREATRKSPWIFSIVVVVCTVGVVWNGLFLVILKAVTLSGITAVLKLYQVLFGLLVFGVEVSRYIDPLKFQAKIQQWCRLLDTALGRGVFQMLTGSLAVAEWESIAEWLPGLVLMVVGLGNIIYGTVAAWKLRTVMAKMKDLEKEKAVAEKRSSSTDISQVDLMVQKFQAMDVNGDGQLTREAMLLACQELNIDLSEQDADTVFRALDRSGKGHVELKDFEKWWFRSKSSGLFV